MEEQNELSMDDAIAQYQQSEPTEDINLDPVESSVNQIERQDNLSMDDAIANYKLQEHVKATSNLMEDTDDADVNGIVKALQTFVYYNDEIGKAFSGGANRAIINTAQLPFDALSSLTGEDLTPDFFDNYREHLDKKFKTTSMVGDVVETGTRVGLGLLGTKGMGSTGVVANATRGAVIEMTVFEGKETNVADIFKQLGLESDVGEYLSTNKNDSELLQRIKNTATGAGLGVAVDSLLYSLKYGRKLFKNTDKEFVGTDAELIKHVEGTIKEDMDKVIKKDVVEEVADDVIEKGAKQTAVKSEFFDGDKALAEAEEYINGTISIPNGKPPINPTGVTNEVTEDTFTKATQNVEANVSGRTFAETTQMVEDKLKKDIGEESFDLMQDMVKTSKEFENLDVKINQQKVIVGLQAKKLEDSIKVAQKEQSASNVMQVMYNLKMLRDTSKVLKDSQGGVARALNSMKIKTANTQMMNNLKLLDALDPDNVILRLKEAGTAKDIQSVMDDILDPTKNLKNKVESISDTMYTKVTNALSESVVAGMLSAPSTLAVNVIGGTLIKHQRMLEDTAQFVWGQVLNSKNKITLREYRHTMDSAMWSFKKDIKVIGKGIKEWGRSGFKDEVFDNNVLVKFKQDQDFAHKYIDSRYLRGIKEGGANSSLNNAINIYGKLARSPYQVIGFVDDYYKRGAFRTELSRLGGRQAVAQNLKGGEFNKYVNEFIQANTELRILKNKGFVPTDDWLNKNQKFIGTGTGLNKYVDLATESANYMTFQKDLGRGLVGKGVNLMNSDGLLRILVPFKMTPINILKHAVSTAYAPLKYTLNGDIIKGGIKGDIARAKITTSVAILTGLTMMATSGKVTGTFTREERDEMKSAGIPELSFQLGNKWFEYKQVEPYATLMGAITDMNKIYMGLQYRMDDARVMDEVGAEYTAVMADLALALTANITNKTYAKSLFEVLEVVSGEKNLVDYSGNLLSSVPPLSSLTNYIGRVTNDGFKKEAVTFTERLKSKYRVLLSRDALDLYGRPIKDTDYVGGFTIKEFDANDPKNKGSMEVARLGLEVGKMPRNITVAGLPVKLDEEQHWKMRRSLDKKFHIASKLNKSVSTSGYKRANDFGKKMILNDLISNAKTGAKNLMIADMKVFDKVKRSNQLKVNEISRPKGERKTWNDLIIGE